MRKIDDATRIRIRDFDTPDGIYVLNAYLVIDAIPQAPCEIGSGAQCRQLRDRRVVAPELSCGVGGGFADDEEEGAFFEVDAEG